MLGTAPGNGGGYTRSQGWTGSFEPRGTSDVRMKSESLDISFRDGYADVRVVYELVNPGRARTVRAGFPVTTVRLDNPGENIFGGRRTLRLLDYSITKNGQALDYKVIREPAPAPVGESSEFVTWVSGWNATEIRFEREESAMVEIRYRMQYHAYLGWVSEDFRHGEETFSYVFSSAATWKGPIERGEVRLHVETTHPEEFTIISPRRRFKREGGNTYVWRFENLEPSPKDDLKIRVLDASRGRQFHSVKDEVSTYEFRGKRAFSEHAFYSARASSTLKPQGKYSYDAKHVADWDKATAWVEGAEGDGIGESLTLKLRKPEPIHHVTIMPGYAARADTWTNNNRVAKLNVLVNGDHSVDVEIPNHGEPMSESFTLGGYTKPVHTLKFTIAGVHRGTKYADTCISAIAVTNELKNAPKFRGAR